MALHSIEETAKAIAALATGFDGDTSRRARLLAQIDKLRYLVEGPTDPILTQWASVTTISALSILTSTGTLAAIPRSGTVSSTELATKTGLDESVIARCMRLICIQGIACEPAPDRYSHDAKSLAFIEGHSKHLFNTLLDHIDPFLKSPEYFRTHNSAALRDVRHAPYSYGHGRDGIAYYDVISEKQERLEAFNGTLALINETLPILGMFPFSSLKAQVEVEPHRPFIVDVGGGIGEVLKEIQKEAPAGFGAQMILQERPDVLRSLDDEAIPHITKMEHDFFTPQPVKDAHVYLLRRVLHDFYEPECVQIVRHVASAMAPDSRLLIGDFVLPEKTHLGDDTFLYWMDFAMMMLTGKEKSAEEFRSILDEAGLEMVKIWSSPVGPQAIIEARLQPT